MKTHKSTNAPDGGYEILCNYEKVKRRNSELDDGKRFTYKWRLVTCKECLKHEKLMREK